MNATGYYFEPRLLRREFPSHVQWSSANQMLSVPECESLIQFAHVLGFGPASVGNPDNNRIDEGYRCVKVASVPFLPKTQWLYERVTRKVQLANDEYYGFDITGLLEAFQLLKYTAADGDKPAGHYHWHQDFGADYMGRRKLSVVINLSDPNDYEGCRLTLMSHRQETMPYVAQGDAVMFPSWTPHMVSDVSRGTRYALVAWVHGAPFR